MNLLSTVSRLSKIAYMVDYATNKLKPGPYYPVAICGPILVSGEGSQPRVRYLPGPWSRKRVHASRIGSELYPEDVALSLSRFVVSTHLLIPCPGHR